MPAARIAVYGRPGTGKSTLAIQLAHEMHAWYPYAQLYVDLEGTSPRPVEPLHPEEALRLLLSQLGVGAADMPGDLDELVALYCDRLRDRRAMVVLDNAADEDQVRPLVPQTSTCLVLITSRRRLDKLTGSARYRLGSMSEQESLDLLRRVAGDDVPAPTGEVLRPPHQPLTGKVAELCGRLPLALRIAGLQLMSSQVREVVARLEDPHSRLEALYTRNLDIRTSFGASYERLSDRERALFRRLRLLVEPSFDGRMAEVLLDCDPELARSALDGLVVEQLLERDGEDRHRFDDLIGLYADERLDRDELPGERNAAGRRVLDLYLVETMSRAALLDPAIVQIGAPPPPSPSSLADQLAALEWFEGQRPKLAAAWRRAVELQAHDVTWKIAASLGPFFELRGGEPEWSQMQKAALDAARAMDDDMCAMAWASFGTGRVCRCAGQLDEARQLLQEAITLATANGWRRLNGRAAHLMGCVEREKGQCREALRRYNLAAASFEAEGLTHEQASTILNVGAALHELGTISCDEVLRLGESARTEVARLDEDLWTVRTMGEIDEYLAGVVMETGDLEGAGVCCIRCRHAYSRIRFRHGQARARRELGRVRIGQGLWGVAKQCLDESRALFEKLGDGAASAQVSSLLETLERERMTARPAEPAQPAPTDAGDRPAVQDATPAAPTPAALEGRLGVFISYSQDDGEIADRVASELRDLGYAVFYAPWSIEPGQSIAGKIDEALGLTDTLVALLSPRSVASRWVRLEWESGLAAINAGEDMLVLPALIEPVEVPRILRGIKLLDMTGDAFDAGLDELKRLLAARRAGAA